jgi:DNA-directed RNA polymerase specialized sigma24 family protein
MLKDVSSQAPTVRSQEEAILDRNALRLIRYHARKLKRSRLFQLVDREDIEQDLTLYLLSKAAKFDPSRSKRRTFVSRILERKVVSLVRRQKRLKHAQLVDCEALDRSCDGAQRLHRGVAGSRPEQLDLAIDVRDVLAAMPAELRELAEVLTSTPLNRAVEKLGISPDEFRRRLRLLRQEFALRGLEPGA